MLKKLFLGNSKKEGNSRNTFSTERVPSRSKLDKGKYRIINSVKKIKPNIHHNYVYSPYYPNSQRKINISNSNKNFLLEEKMPYIPNKERLKSESNFINLIKELINSRKTEDNINRNILLKKEKNIPYKPKGYNYYEYIREHPILIGDDEDDIYSKIVNDLKKKNETDKNNSNYENSKSYNNLNKLTKNKNLDNILSFDENDKSRLLNPLINKSYKYLPKLNIKENNLSDISKSDRQIYRTIDYNEDVKKDHIFHILNNNSKVSFVNNQIEGQKDYRKSDVFNLVNDNLSKSKSSEKYLFKKNYMPQKIEKEKETGINEKGWFPKGHNNKSRIGVSSVAFNIISPGLQNFSPMKKDIDLLNKNHFEKAPLMSEYVDLCKLKGGALRQEYTDKLNENNNAFHKKNYCASYNNLYHEYKDIVDHVF